MKEKIRVKEENLNFKPPQPEKVHLLCRKRSTHSDVSHTKNKALRDKLSATYSAKNAKMEVIGTESYKLQEFFYLFYILASNWLSTGPKIGGQFKNPQVSEVKRDDP